jgi:hypothetical protein
MCGKKGFADAIKVTNQSTSWRAPAQSHEFFKSRELSSVFTGEEVNKTQSVRRI